MRAVDTNLLVRLLARDDAAQVTAAETFVEQALGCPTCAGRNAVGARCGLRANPGTARKAIDLLLNHKNLTLQDADVVAAALARFRARPSLGFSDCLVLEIARKAGHLPLGTFDRNLAKLDGALAL